MSDQCRQELISHESTLHAVLLFLWSLDSQISRLRNSKEEKKYASFLKTAAYILTASLYLNWKSVISHKSIFLPLCFIYKHTHTHTVDHIWQFHPRYQKFIFVFPVLLFIQSPKMQLDENPPSLLWTISLRNCFPSCITAQKTVFVHPWLGFVTAWPDVNITAGLLSWAWCCLLHRQNFLLETCVCFPLHLFSYIFEHRKTKTNWENSHHMKYINRVEMSL